MNAKRVPLSAGEMEIMEIVWDRTEVAAQQVRDALTRRRSISRNTVRTMLARMERKGWLTHRLAGQTYFYRATVPREKSLGQRVLELVDRACGGQPERLMNALINYRGLTPDEVASIRAMLEEAEPKARAKRRKKK